MDSRKEEAIQAVIGGVGTDVMAEELGVSRATIYNWLEEGDYLEQMKEIRDWEVAQAYRADWPIEEIYEEFEISQTTLYNALRRHDVKLRRTPVGMDDEAMIVFLYTEGFPVQKIIESTGRCKYTVYQVLHKNKVKLRRYSKKQGR